ncbi:MAG: hypothetical protein PHU25_15370 [Deltaproteobacteria bacterium]|nr:hypothetical protein [Deltaproteobacteria bacterium]
MASILIDLPPPIYEAVLKHLLPPNAHDEEAAFLFVRDDIGVADRTMALLEWIPVERAGFAYQSAGYLELADEVRPEVIKRAHDLGACIVEMHSHPSPWPAAFSPTDLAGLEEFVPHVRWRLKRRPYVAIVMAPSGFDALAWTDESGKPEPISGLLVAGNLLRPSGITFAHRLSAEVADE